MNTNKNLVLLQSLMSILKIIRGRKKFQKIVYILKRLGVGFEEKFSYHYFGPYSSELQIEVDYLVDDNVFSEKKGAGSSYVYEVTNNKITNIDAQIENKRILIEKFNTLDAKLLEVLSTILYLTDMGYTEEEAFKKAKFLKPDHVSYFEGAENEYKTLKEKYSLN